MTPTTEQLAAILPMFGIKLKPEDLEERVIAQMVDRILGEESEDVDFDLSEDFDSSSYRGTAHRLRSKTIAAIRVRIDAAVDRYFATHLESKFDELVRSVVFPVTNRYGEKRGEPETLLEHLSQKAKEYMSEKVNSSGEKETYHSGTPRLVWMLEKHFKADMQRAIGEALASMGQEMAAQLKQTVERSVAALKVSR